MRAILLSLLLIFFVISAVASDAELGPAKDAIGQSQTEGLKLRRTVLLNARIVEQHYCTQIIDSHTRYPKLRLKVEFAFRNAGIRPLIIHKYANEIYQVLLSKTTANARAGRYAYDEHSSLMPAERLFPRDFPETAPTDEFEIVKPKETYDYQYAQEIDISLRDLGDSKWRLRPGDYFLQFIIQMWPWETEKARQLERHWAKYGDFWYYDIKSEPMPLKIERPSHVTMPCQ